MFFRFSTYLTSGRFLVPKIIKAKYLKYFEATCDRPKKYEQEIIEFPCLKLNAKTLAEEGRFHRFVRPTINPILTEFCVELTGILQEMIDDEETFPEVFEAFEKWRAKESLTDENSLYITSGDWDLGHMLPVQCEYSGLKTPSHMHTWADIKKVFADNTGQYKGKFNEILNYYNLKQVGRLHSGLDDCVNVGNVLRCLIHSKGIVYPTSKLIVDGGKRKVMRLKMAQKEPLKHLLNKS